jgi:hypothetical protein
MSAYLPLRCSPESKQPLEKQATRQLLFRHRVVYSRKKPKSSFQFLSFKFLSVFTNNSNVFLRHKFFRPQSSVGS